MKPPICALCNQHLSSVRVAGRTGGGDVVQFADFRPLPQGMVGHPQGLEWFCAKHIAAATALSHLPFDAALAQMRKADSAGGHWRRLLGWLRSP